MGTVFVAGALANKPGNGGEAWVRLSWILGLRRLGYEVIFVEQLSRGADSAAVGFFAAVVERFGLAATSSLIGQDGTALFGMPVEGLLAKAEAADALFNISGHLTYQPLLDRIPRKVYVDVDPGYTQYWHATGSSLGLEAHDEFLTVGGNLGTRCCPIPTLGIDWRPVRPPVVLAEWASTAGRVSSRFSTVASWRGAFGPVVWEGRQFGVKAHEFRKVAGLPKRAPGEFELALAIDPWDAKDRNLLTDNGWQLTEPRTVADTPEAFRTFVQHSAAELSVAQGIYVDTNSGWVSDRTAAYLAVGRPALVQDTGIGRTLPTGEGLLTFRTLDEAVAGVHDIRDNYDRHSRVARELAEAYFDSDLVLSPLVAGP